MKHYKKWNKANLDILKVLVDKGFSHPEIAYILKRTISAIATQCSKSGICNNIYITPAQLLVIKEMSQYGFSAEDISKSIKRPVVTVRSACYSLGIKLNSVQKAKPEEIKKAVRMLKDGASTNDVAKAIPGWSISMATHLKAKYKIEGLKRGGKKTVPESEIELVRTLAKQDLSYGQMAEEMTTVLGRHITEAQVRGRVRFHRIPHISQRSRCFGKDWSKEEDSVLKSSYAELGDTPKAKAIMTQLLPGRNREAIRKRLSRII